MSKNLNKKKEITYSSKSAPKIWNFIKLKYSINRNIWKVWNSNCFWDPGYKSNNPNEKENEIYMGKQNFVTLTKGFYYGKQRVYIAFG